MADTRNNRRARTQARPGGKGTGKVTAGRGRSQRRDAKAERTVMANQKAAAKKEEPAVAGAVAGPEASAAASEAEGATPSAVKRMGSTRVRDRGRLSEKMNRSTRLRLWLQSSAPDFLLVLVVSTALIHTVARGFYSAEAHQGNFVLIAGLTIPLLAAMFAGSWSKRALLPSAAATVVLFVVYVGASMALSPESGALFVDGELNDVPENYSIFTMVICVVALLVYLLSRRTTGLVLLLILCVATCGFVQYAWPEWLTVMDGAPTFVVAFLGVLMLFVYQCYKQSVYSANRAKRTSFAGAFGYSALVGAICLLVGVGVFSCISAIVPETVQFKPFEEHVSPPVDEKANSYEQMEVEGDDKSQNTNDEQDEADTSDTGGDMTANRGLGFLEGTVIGNMAQSLAGFDPDDPNQDFNNIDYLILRWELLIMGVLLALLVLTAVLVQRSRRAIRLRRIASKPEGYQAWYLYTFLIERFRRLKLAKPDHLTPLEFAVGFSKPMLPFTRGTDGVDFVDVSSVYQDAVFGGEPPTDEELEDVKTYYKAFFKNARQYVGLPKWCLWKFWRV